MESDTGPSDVLRHASWANVFVGAFVVTMRAPDALAVLAFALVLHVVIFDHARWRFLSLLKRASSYRDGVYRVRDRVHSITSRLYSPLEPNHW